MIAGEQPERDSLLLRVERFGAGLGRVRLLEGIEFGVRAGEIVALTGPSGCGKTTLLRAIAGLMNPLEGEVRFNGRCPEAMGWPRYRRQVTLVDQRPVLLDTTVLENLQRPFRYQVAAAPFPEARARELLELVGIEQDRLSQNAKSLSEGQQQRVCLVRALLVKPAVLLLDEPTSTLDENSLDAVETLVRRIAAGQALAALIVTHDTRQAARWCDRVIDLGPHVVR